MSVCRDCGAEKVEREMYAYKGSIQDQCRACNRLARSKATKGIPRRSIYQALRQEQEQHRCTIDVLEQTRRERDSLAASLSKCHCSTNDAEVAK